MTVYQNIVIRLLSVIVNVSTACLAILVETQLSGSMRSELRDFISRQNTEIEDIAETSEREWGNG